MKVATESILRIDNPEYVGEIAFDAMRSYSTSQSKDGSNFILGFGSARLIFRVHQNFLWLRAEADDVTSCCGVETLVVAALSTFAPEAPRLIRWIEATRDPFYAASTFEGLVSEGVASTSDKREL